MRRGKRERERMKKGSGTTELGEVLAGKKGSSVGMDLRGQEGG